MSSLREKERKMRRRRRIEKGFVRKVIRWLDRRRG